VRFPEPVNAAVYQLVCSPLNNRLPPLLRPLFRLGWSKPLAAVLRWWSRRTVEPQPVEWDKVTGPHVGNMIATLRTTGQTAEMVLERTRVDGGLSTVATVPLNGDQA
jgi:hypothetical protein